MTDGWKSAERTEDIRSVMMKLSDLFSPSFGGQVIFRLFGPYEGIPNLLFTVRNLNRDQRRRKMFYKIVSFFLLFQGLCGAAGGCRAGGLHPGLGGGFRADDGADHLRLPEYHPATLSSGGGGHLHRPRLLLDGLLSIKRR